MPYRCRIETAPRSGASSLPMPEILSGCGASNLELTWKTWAVLTKRAIQKLPGSTVFVPILCLLAAAVVLKKDINCRLQQVKEVEATRRTVYLRATANPSNHR